MALQKKYRERLEMAADLLMRWRPSKAKAFDMGSFVESSPCGTAYCAAGYLGIQPWFQRRGFITSPAPEELHVNGAEVSAFNYSPLATFFGVPHSVALEFFDWDETVKTPQEIARRIRAYLKAQA